MAATRALARIVLLLSLGQELTLLVISCLNIFSYLLQELLFVLGSFGVGSDIDALFGAAEARAVSGFSERNLLGALVLAHWLVSSGRLGLLLWS